MYDPTLGRWTTEDPGGFAEGDMNLYRYVENQPTNATDPTGKYLIAKNEDLAREFQREVAGAVIHKLASGRYYIDVPAKSFHDLFEWTNSPWVDIFAKEKGNNWETRVGERNAFLFAAGVGTESQFKDTVGELTKSRIGRWQSAKAVLTKPELEEIGKLTAKRKFGELTLDIGGTGRYTTTKTGIVINVNVEARSDFGDIKGEPIPNYLYGDLNKGLPIPDNSVSLAYVENMPVDLKWTTNIVRVMKPHGKIIVYDFIDDDFPQRRLLNLFTAAAAKFDRRISWKALGDYLKGTPYGKKDKYPGGGQGFEIIVHGK